MVVLRSVASYQFKQIQINKIMFYSLDTDQYVSVLTMLCRTHYSCIWQHVFDATVYVGVENVCDFSPMLLPLLLRTILLWCRLCNCKTGHMGSFSSPIGRLGQSNDEFDLHRGQHTSISGQQIGRILSLCLVV